MLCIMHTKLLFNEYFSNRLFGLFPRRRRHFNDFNNISLNYTKNVLL